MHEFAAEPLNHRNVAADGLFDAGYVKGAASDRAAGRAYA
jgi:hypothetical protein